MERDNILMKILRLVEGFIQKVMHFSYFKRILQVSKIDSVSFLSHAAVFAFRCCECDFQL